MVAPQQNVQNVFTVASMLLWKKKRKIQSNLKLNDYQWNRPLLHTITDW